MITELTRAQKDLLPVYVDKWTKIGLSTERVNHKKAEEISDYLYKNILKKKPVPVIIAPSPLSAWYMALYATILSESTLSKINKETNVIINELRRKIKKNNYCSLEKILPLTTIWVNTAGKCNNTIMKTLMSPVWSAKQNKIEDILHKATNEILVKIKETVLVAKDSIADHTYKSIAHNTWNVYEPFNGNAVKISGSIRYDIERKVKFQVYNKIYDNIRQKIRSEAMFATETTKTAIWDQIYNGINDNTIIKMFQKLNLNKIIEITDDNIDNKLCDFIYDEVRNKTSIATHRKILWEFYREIENLRKNSFVWPYMDGHFSAAFFSFYNYISEVLNIKLSEEYYWYEKTSELGIVYPLENVCIVSDRPVSIKMKDGRLHADGTPAIEYSDGFSVYALNGVRVSEEIATTPWNKLDARLLAKENNAEVRREIVKKIGIEKICKDLNAKKIDSHEDYELLMLDIGDKTQRPYLKMKNPSIGCYHIEGTPPECDTVEKALHSRKPEEMRRIPVDDVYGEVWYQQGDVCIWPENAVLLKNRPIVLT